ncbi:MAG: tRNA (adenosine(37)-N6)-dimethylallyltransferase MiaA [Candidatus Omnitrophica bacterium CG11_big_fil_rev_8_21_14_0_20_41_12]|nr:MAG: tRNA (adenosine(37)-N6)-dimethylallyltransferase MiaA [Candidatus Omnitrophica bacterium CG11_big_fil_rev_8_21_14_0_20_41_12]
MLKKKIIFLLGPTAIGKSAIAIKLAKKIKAEIISCDSMQVYRGMDILTSKVDSAQRKKIRHHLLDVIAPSQEYNVAKYRRDALLICNELFLKGKIPFFVGGTGLYYSIIIDGLFPKVSKDRSIRAKLNKALQLKGSRYLYKKLARVDAQAAKKIHPHDSRRIIRALEVYLKTGKPISVLQKSRVGLGDEYEINIFGLNLNRELLYKKIDQRVDKMFKLGLVNEVKRLVKYRLSKTAAQAIGIRELGGYFNGEYALEEARRLIQRNSRHYAKRQCSWFKNDKRIMWININKTQTSAQIALKLWKKLS